MYGLGNSLTMLKSFGSDYTLGPSSPVDPSSEYYLGDRTSLASYGPDSLLELSNYKNYNIF